MGGICSRAVAVGVAPASTPGHRRRSRKGSMKNHRNSIDYGRSTMLRKRRSGEVVLASTSGTHSDAEGMSVTASRRASARSAYSASSGGAALPGSAHPDGGDGDAVRPKSSSSARSRPKSAKKDVNQLVGYQSDGLLDGNNSFIDLR